MPFLQARGVNQLTAVIASHADNDHIGGLPFVLESMWVDEVIEGGSTSRSKVYKEFAQVIDELKLRHILVKRGDYIAGIPNARLAVLHPTEGFLSQRNSNNKSVVLHMRYGGVSFLFTGDAEREAEQDAAEMHED